MKKYASLLVVLSVLGLTGCSLPVTSPNQTGSTNTAQTADSFTNTIKDLGSKLALQTQITQLFAENALPKYYYPVADYTTKRSSGIFSQYVPDHGYLTGDDLIVSNATPVVVLTDATVVWKDTLPDYGGTVIISFTGSDGVVYHALYSGLDLSTVSVNVNAQVTAGSQLGTVAGKELHFTLYPYTTTELFTMYVSIDSDLTHWADPATFLRTQQAVSPEAN